MFKTNGQYVMLKEHFTDPIDTYTTSTTTTTMTATTTQIEQVIEAHSKVLIKLLSNMGLTGIKAQLQTATQSMANKDYEAYANTMIMIAEMKTNAFS